MSKAEKIVERPHPEYGSDVIVDLLKAFDIEYISFNPGATFRGLHDSLVNYSGNHMPEIISCTHEESAVAIAHGYGRAKGRPMVTVLHNVVGLQHGAMAIYNAWCDRVPVIVMGGTGPMDTARRRPWIDWVHTALVQGTLVRDFVKWDDQPASVQAVPESFIRAYRLATTEPMGPVYVCYDVDVQEEKLEKEVPFPSLDRYPAALPMQSPEEGFATTIQWLLEAKAPVIIADWVGRKEAGFQALAELAELLAIPVMDLNGRLNFSFENPLNLTGAQEEVLDRTDLLLVLDVPDFEGAVSKRAQERGNRKPIPLLSERAKIINVGLDDLLISSWSHDFNRLRESDLSILADTSVFLPELVRRLKDEKKQLEKQGSDIEKRRGEWSKISAERAEALAHLTKIQWDEKPIATNRLFSEMAEVLKNEDWVLTHGPSAAKERFFLRPTKFNQVLGKYKGGGLGYGLPASLGAALAYKDSGKICVDLQPDGDLLFTVSSLWTAAHHRIPLLMVVFNNRAYFNDEEHQERMALLRGRAVENKGIGIRINDPVVDFGAMARTYGVWGVGPITEPRDLTKALREALKVVKEEGRPALVDVVCQDR